MAKSGDTMQGGVRKRNAKSKSSEATEYDSHKKKAKPSRKEGKYDEKSDWKVIDWFFGAISNIVGVLVMIMVSFKFAEYLEMLHENEYWFSNIKEVEREISFRTEQGLYYFYFKKLVRAKSFNQGFQSLLADNKTESGHTINVINRFNIYPEILLAYIYRYFDLKDIIPAIFFYVKTIFSLNGLYVASIYFTTWSLCGSWLAGLLSVGLYVLNLEDASRVNYTVPLRESFSGPFIFAQLAFFVLYLKTSKVQVRRHFYLFFFGIFTFLFTMSWQFGQFILLLQSFTLFLLTLINIVPYHQMWNIFSIEVMVLLLNYGIHYGQQMILSSLVLSFIPIAIVMAKFQLKYFENSKGCFKNLFLLIVTVVATVLLTAFVNSVVKDFLNIQDDNHIFKFLKAKLLFEETRDFETKLYLCNGAFNYMDLLTINRLWSRLLLPIYIPVEVTLLLGLCWCCVKRWRTSKDQTRSEDESIFVKRPDLSFWILLNFMFGLLALSTLRMKMFWTPQMCVVASIGVTDHKLWFSLISKLSSKARPWLIRVICVIGCIALITTIIVRMMPVIAAQMDDLKEFWDPDTVELMGWIKTNTSSSAVFAGSMQLLAGVKLCTNRGKKGLTEVLGENLGHGPNGVRTSLVYQLYGRKSPEEIHEILKSIGTTHIILEDSICMAPSHKFCRLPDIVDINNGELPDSLLNKNPPQEYSDLKRVETRRFCDEIRHINLPYSKYFKKVFSNKTFRIYKLI
ncbi:putative C-mannosyltransferase DPY19L3 [Nymphon striatum]|nr:putative C-mannosyltransferase DPY19L3 [Nymphon striatum]KAG1658411.1 putative C-mannosyltransferase DPY19L3 [Nymphon striatum]